MMVTEENILECLTLNNIKMNSSADKSGEWMERSQEIEF
jgi:hypothetical protein